MLGADGDPRRVGGRAKKTSLRGPTHFGPGRPLDSPTGAATRRPRPGLGGPNPAKGGSGTRPPRIRGAEAGPSPPPRDSPGSPRLLKLRSPAHGQAAYLHQPVHQRPGDRPGSRTAGAGAGRSKAGQPRAAIPGPVQLGTPLSPGHGPGWERRDQARINPSTSRMRTAWQRRDRNRRLGPRPGTAHTPGPANEDTALIRAGPPPSPATPYAPVGNGNCSFPARTRSPAPQHGTPAFRPPSAGPAQPSPGPLPRQPDLVPAAPEVNPPKGLQKKISYVKES